MIINTMKRGWSTVFLALLLSMSFAMAVDIPQNYPTVVSSGTVFSVTALRYEPYPVSPGEQFEIWVKVQNIGTTTADNATCMLKTDYPFSLYQGDAEKSYGKINAGDAVVFQYKLSVSQNASQGSNELQLWCTKNPSSGAWEIAKINVLVQTRYPTLNIKTIRTDPKIIEPGKDAKLLFTLENLADSAMKDIIIKLDLSSVDIAPSGEISEKKLRLLESNGIADLIFSIKALPAAQGGIYKVPFSLTYSDNLGKSYEQTGLIGIEVGSEPELIFSIDSTTISKSSKVGEASIKIINSGLTDLKFVSVEILSSEKFKILSTPTIYIGDVDSDDFGTVDYKLSVKTSDDFEIPLKLMFKDAINNDYSKTVNVHFNMLSASEMGKKSAFASIIPTVIVIVILLVIFIRKLRETVKSWIIIILNRFKKK